MRFRSILLRLLLCLALVANGTSAVYASARMAPAPQSAAQPCHDMPAMAHAAIAAGDEAPSPPPSHADCCPPGACLCSCVSHASTLLPSQSFALPPRPAAAPVAAVRVSFPSPVLPNPIRPPIG